MSFADTCVFLFNVLAGTVFLCQVVYFSALGIRVFLKNSKLGRDIQEDNEAYRELMRPTK